jgi:adenine-specific DNA-methyltransferase
MAKSSASPKKRLEDFSREELLELVKTLKKRKKYGLVWESKQEDVISRCKAELPVLEEVKERAVDEVADQPTNLIIEGDNYHALSVLNYTHAGKIDLIYIDPPYNTGAKDWKYNNAFVDINDTFRHSKWLSMMYNRLVLAKKLLKKDGVLICAIDENEHAHLGVMLEELFPDKELHSITIVHNPRGVQGKNFSYTHEYAYFVIPSGTQTIIERQIPIEERDASNLRNWGGESLRSDAKNCFYPILMSKDGVFIKAGDVPKDSFHPKFQFKEHEDGSIEFWPIDDEGVERKWRYARQTIESIQDILIIKKIRNKYEIQIAKTSEKYRTVWQSPRYDASTYGTKLIKTMVPTCDFSFPKSLWTVYDCLYAVVGNNKKAIVLDFFAGSGTTAHAVLKLNEQDDGKRRSIMVTNNENGIAEECTYPRIKAAIEGFADEKGIPANLRYLKTSFVARDEASDDTRRKLVLRSTEMICIRENTFTKKADKKGYKIFTNDKQATGVLIDLDLIEEFKLKLDILKLPANLYVFSLTDDVFADDFANLSVRYTLCPIPESILEVYRKLCE